MRKLSFYAPIIILVVIAAAVVFTYPYLGTNPAGKFTGILSVGCRETDYGRDPFTFGITQSIAGMDEVKVDADYCRSEVDLVEFYCDKGYSNSATVSCSFYDGFCSNGMCVVG
jgi:hypothetical protein